VAGLEFWGLACAVGRISELILYPRILLCSPLLFGRQHLRDQRGNICINLTSLPAYEVPLKVAEFDVFLFAKGSLSKFWPGELASGVLG